MRRMTAALLVIASVLSAVGYADAGAPAPPAPGPVTIRNPWIVNDRVADCRSVQTMGATFKNAYTPDGVTPPADDQAIAINCYNNHKRRVYHWADVPPNGPNGIVCEDPVYSVNIFGRGLCYLLGPQAQTITYNAGLGARKIGLPGHIVYEVYYNGRWHLLDTMTTMYVMDRGTPAQIASCADIKADPSLMGGAVLEGRACPGFLLCGDSVGGYLTMISGWEVHGGGLITNNWSMNMDLRAGESFDRTCEFWANQHPPAVTGAPDPPFHHEAQHDWKDYVNYPYWEPYMAVMRAYGSYNIPTYRRWSNGTYEMRPDFCSAAYQAMVYGTPANVATFHDDGLSPDLHLAAPGTGEVVFKVKIPFYLTDATVSGQFVRHDAGDATRIFVSPDGANWTLVWDNTQTGTTTLSNLSLRAQVFAKWQYYVKIQLVADGAKTDAGVSGLVIRTLFEHNKGATAYLDKGINHVTVTFDNPQDLPGNGVLRVTYRWKEYDGANWTIDRQFVKYVRTSPATFTITAGGAKVPRTESVKMEVLPPLLPGDVDADDIVDVFDVIDVVILFGTSQGSPQYRDEADFDLNGTIDVFDVMTVIENFGMTR